MRLMMIPRGFYFVAATNKIATGTLPGSRVRMMLETARRVMIVVRGTGGRSWSSGRGQYFEIVYHYG